MNMKKIAMTIFALLAFPALAYAEAEMRGTVLKLDKAEKQLVLQTDKGEEMLFIVGSSKGLAYAKEGSRVAVKFSEKDGQPKVVEIKPQESGTVNILGH
jgi:Cu/Ag efflux protein CusF